jgi:hypothetical protein
MRRPDIEGPDRGQYEAALLALGEEPGARPGIGSARMRVPGCWKSRFSGRFAMRGAQKPSLGEIGYHGKSMG